MTSRSVWFGSRELPLAGRLSLPPSQRARAAVALCTPIGVESHLAHPAYRRLALELERRGIATLRFDYAGTGDSAGDLSSAGPEEWLESVLSAIGFLRDSGAEHVALVGLRLGGTLAARAAAMDGNVDGLVLWDACASGRSFLREHRALREVSLAHIPKLDEPGARDLVGIYLPPDRAEQVAALDLGALDRRPKCPVLSVDRADASTSSQLEAWLEGLDAERALSRGQAEFIDVPPGISVLPLDTIGCIAEWLDVNAPEALRPFEATTTDEAVVAHKGADAVRERVVTFGSLGLFGIVTEPVGEASGPPIVLPNVGLLHHIGPGRLWVELARRWASDGRRVIRFDLRGIGESPLGPDQGSSEIFPIEASEDVQAAAGVVAEDPRDVVLIGICSGAYHSIVAGLALAPRAVGLINPVLNFDAPGVITGGTRRNPDAVGRPLNPVIRAMRQNRVIVRMAKVPLLARMRRAWGHFADTKLPTILWKGLDRLHLVPLDARALVSLVDRCPTVALICGRAESRPFHRARRDVRNLERNGKLRYHLHDDVDHSVLSAHARSIVIAALEEDVIAPTAWAQPATRTRARGPLVLGSEAVAQGAEAADGRPSEPVASPS